MEIKCKINLCEKFEATINKNDFEDYLREHTLLNFNYDWLINYIESGNVPEKPVLNKDGSKIPFSVAANDFILWAAIKPKNQVDTYVDYMETEVK